jgi:ferrochelatase
MKDAVIALGMGGPLTESDVESFLFNLLSDRDLINFHLGDTLQRKFAACIAKRRAAKVIPRYKIIGGGSPQLRHTEGFLTELKKRYLESSGTELDTFIGMCYFHPFIEDAVKRIAEGESYRRLYLFPLYPQYCSATTAIAFKRFFSAAESCLKGNPAEIIRIDDYHAAPSFIKAAANRINAAAEKLGKKAGEIPVLYSAHSIPVSLAAQGDPYPSQIAETARLITEAVKPLEAHLAFQSRVGFGRWLKPTSYEVIKTLAARGVKEAAVFAPSFINDHIETLYDIDVDLVSFATGFGIKLARGEAFNASDDFALAAARILTAA